MQAITTTMNGDSNFKTAVYNNSQKYKSAFIEKVLRENFLSINNGAAAPTTAAAATSKCSLDETKLKNLNSILSNLSYESIKKINEKNQLEQNSIITNGSSSNTNGYSSGSTSSGTKNTLTDSSSTTTTTTTTTNNNNIAATGNSPKIESGHQSLQLIKKASLINNFRNERRRSSSKVHPATPNAKKSAPSKQSTQASLLASSHHSMNNSESNLASSLTNSSQIVIHVCDEARRLKQDFTCPRDLLVKEMKYFSYNLNINVSNTSHSTSGAHAHSSIPTSALSKKSLDEIDISVHCDINIFDWLMRYVKRNHPFLIEKTIASPQNVNENSAGNGCGEAKDGLPIKTYEPNLEINNCVSILLSSDFLIMGDLVDKCIVFIAQNLEAVLQIQCVLNGISDYIITKLAACVSIRRLDNIYDKKDKLKTKLFQRKIEFLFDVEKFKSQFENSFILSKWMKTPPRKESLADPDETHPTTSNETQETEPKIQRTKSILDTYDALADTNYNNFLYECENDASTLFKCKLCSKLMTRQQSLNLKCQLAILNAHGDYIYLHVPDDNFDMTCLLKLLKEKLKLWQSVYWFLWALIKSFKCRKCNQWFRLVDMNRCRLNEQSFCSIHDAKSHNFFYQKNNTNNTSASINSTATTSMLAGVTNANTDANTLPTCTCIYINHILESSSFTSLYANSPICLDETSPCDLTSEQKLARYLDHIMEDLDKHNDIIFHGKPGNKEPTSDNISICDIIEEYIQTDKFKNASLSGQSTVNSLNSNNNSNSNNNNNSNNSTNTPLLSNATANLNNNNNTTSISNSFITNKILKIMPKTQLETYECGFFIDSITGKHISLLDKHLLNLIKLSQLTHTTFTDPAQNSQMLSSNAYNINAIVHTGLDLKTFLFLINFMDVRNVFNCLEALHFLRITNKMKWDCSKPIRFNQDNQREDDLKKFREISNYLIRAKLIDEYQKPPALKSSIASLLMQQQQQNVSNLVSSPGGMYCRVENEWKIRRN